MTVLISVVRVGHVEKMRFEQDQRRQGSLSSASVGKEMLKIR